WGARSLKRTLHAGPDGAPSDGGGRDGAGRDGAGRDGAGRDGAGRDVKASFMLLWRVTITGRRRGHFSDHAKTLQLREKRCRRSDGAGRHGAGGAARRTVFNAGFGWAALAGLATGWYAITRPLDAICVLAPVAIAWMWDLRRLPARARIIIVGIVMLAGAPLIALQLAFDRAVTGQLLEAPLARYNRVYFNAASFGLQHYDPAFRPPSPVVQIQRVYDYLDQPAEQYFTTFHDALKLSATFRIPLALGSDMPTLLLIVLLPVSIMGLRNGRRWVLWSMAGCYLAGAGCFYIYMPQYALALAPSVIFALALGAAAIEQAWPAMGIARVLLPMLVLGLAVRTICLNDQKIFEPFPGTVSRTNYLALPKLVHKPALVMCRIGEYERVYEEPVYNWDVTWPDDAPIIRAHDLGAARNRALYQYYAKRQPERWVYLFDREKNTVTLLGQVCDLVGPAHHGR
ncbi:MAG TPA: hypothetical protein VFC78_24195, partial [Tepidisphaeraceae bacterium]|nr:hypothetical protein [Tepidisphaeraceae bacterium]